MLMSRFIRHGWASFENGIRLTPSRRPRVAAPWPLARRRGVSRR